MRKGLPAPTPILVGRDAELARIRGALDKVRVALLYGLPGVGKSALAYALAAEAGAPAVVYRRVTAAPLGALVDDLGLELGGDDLGDARGPDDGGAVADLGRLLDTRGALLVLDDVDALAPADRAALLDGLAGELRVARVIATSRELVPLSPGGPDRAGVRIGRLSREAAAALWRALDDLHGPTAGFERAAARAHGNPYQLRRAHAGKLDDADPIGDLARGLGEDEARVAAALALARARVPVAALAELLPGDALRRALRGLVAKLVVDVDAEETCAIEPLLRDAVLARGGAAPAARAGAYLVERGEALLRAGAARELMADVEAVPEAERGPDVRLLRARCLARLFELPTALAEHEALVHEAREPRDEIRLGLGECALACGSLELAVAELGALAAKAGLTPRVAERAVVSAALALTQAGHGDAARRALRDAELAASGDAAATFAIAQALTLWLEERDAEAAEPLRRARAAPSSGDRPLLSSNALPHLVTAVVLSRRGRFAEADAALGEAAKRTSGEPDPWTEAWLRRARASVAYDRGDRLGALAEATALEAACHRGGCVVDAAWARAFGARILLTLGRRAEALRILDEVAAKCLELGLANVGGTVARGREVDLFAALKAPPVALEGIERPGELARARAIEALRSASIGDARARALVEANAAAAREPGYALERAAGHVALEMLARIARDAARADEQHRLAARAADEGGVDADLLPKLVAAIGKHRLVSSDRPPAAGPTPDLRRFDVVIDGRTHELRGRQGVIPLDRRPVLRRLLYALASSPNRPVSKEALASCIWESRYDPLRHDNAIWVNLRRLRQLLEPSGLRIELDEGGYRLQTPEHFLYLDPG